LERCTTSFPPYIRSPDLSCGIFLGQDYIGQIHHQICCGEPPVIFERRSGVLQSPQGRLLSEIPMWMKVLLVEEGMFPIPLEQMEV
jgi:hypothetical protein